MRWWCQFIYAFKRLWASSSPPCSVLSCWYIKISHGRWIYTMELNKKYYKIRLLGFISPWKLSALHCFPHFVSITEYNWKGKNSSLKTCWDRLWIGFHTNFAPQKTDPVFISSVPAYIIEMHYWRPTGSSHPLQEKY